MFEVGKKYQRIDESGTIVDCVYVTPSLDFALLTRVNGNPFVRYAGDLKYYREYVEPVKHVRYFLIRKAGILGPYRNKENMKESLGYPGNLGIQRVEFVEGTWDE